MSTNAPQPKPYENPIASAASYASQVLAGIQAGTATTPDPYVRTPGFSARQASQRPERSVTQRPDMIRQSASRQHENRLVALRRKRELSLAQSSGFGRGGGGSGPGGGHSYGRGGRAFEAGGRYGLSQGATNALSALNAAYRQRFGQDLVINSGGRSYEDQARLYAAYRAGRGNLAAPPGTSVHESGRAVDFGGPIQNARSAQHVWLQQNAGRFGWLWTGKNFSQFEPWHWEWHG